MKLFKCTLFGLVFFNLGFPSPGTAQVGIRLGVDISSFYYTDLNLDPDFDYEVDLRPYLGYDIRWVQFGAQKPVYYPSFGVFYKHRISNRFHFQQELVFKSKGVSFDQNSYNDIIYNVKINSLEYPVSLLYQPVRKENFILSLLLGGFGSYNVSAIKKTKSPIDDTVNKRPIKTIKNFDGGIHTGMVFSPKIHGKFIHFNLKIYMGLSDIFKQDSLGVNIYHSTQKTKITGIKFSIAYEIS